MKLGVIGCGKMGSALVEGIVAAGICEGADVVAYDAHEPTLTRLCEAIGAHVAADNAEVITKSDAILLCVKPQGFADMMQELGDAADKLLISVAAGVLIETMEQACDGKHRIIRVMPNTPCLVGRGASAYALGTAATEEDAAITEQMLSSVGYVCRVSETDIDAVTALSGSGPAYIFLMIEALVESATDLGLSPEVAHNLAVETVAGAAELVQQTGESPTTLRENVTSPNGTTFAALESFRADGFASIVQKAVTAARDRSIELGKS